MGEAATIVAVPMVDNEGMATIIVAEATMMGVAVEEVVEVDRGRLLRVTAGEFGILLPCFKMSPSASDFVNIWTIGCELKVE